jgi:hypothetical protein
VVVSIKKIQLDKMKCWYDMLNIFHSVVIFERSLSLFPGPQSSLVLPCNISLGGPADGNPLPSNNIPYQVMSDVCHILNDQSATIFLKH